MRSVSFVSWRVFRRSVLLPVGAFLLLSIAGLSSSSEADEPLFARSAQQLERLWGSVLGCAHPGDGEPRSTFETTLDGGNASSAIDHDYVECGKRALRNTSSRMLVDTIEDTLRQGGVALFDERFRLSSGIGWVWGESVTGEFDALIPLLDNEHSNGTGQALFLQPGAIFWPGLEGENRIDANLGLVYRRHFTPDIVVGGSAFYDYDFKQGSQRLGLGMDLQNGILHTALNYYHPLDDWQEGRAGYVEQPLQGADFRLGVTWSRFQLDTSVGIWRFEGDEEEKTKWRPAFGVEAGYQILPGVFLQGGYERHDSDDSLDSRWNAGLAFRFSLPGFEGSEGSNGRVVQPNLWELFEREKRVLYEERRVLQIPMSSQSQAIREPRDSGNMPTTTKVIGVISGRELREDETIEVVVYESTTAQYGQASDNDFTFSQGVYGVDTQTGGHVTLMGSSACAASPCRMDAPANSKAKSIEIEVSALDDSVEKEIPEFIDIRIDIRDGSGNLVHSSDVVRVTIQGHGNTIAFSSDTGSIAEENETSFNITLHIDEPLPAGTDASVTLARSGTATDDDYTLSPVRGNNGTLIDDVWTLPTETETATLQITAVDDSDDDDSGPERASFTLTNLTGATGWSLGSATIQHVDITEEDAGAPRTGSAFIWGDIDTPDGDFGDTIRILDMNTVKFTAADSTVADEGEMVTISGELEALSLPVTLNLMVDNASSADLGDDFRYGHKVYELDAATGQQSAPASATNCPAATCEMLIPAGVTRFDVDVDILADATLKEIPEEIVLRVDVPEEHRSIIRGNETTVIIRAHGNTVGFASSSADELMENSGTARVTVDVDLPSPTSITLNVAATDDAATVMIDRDYTISTRSLLIPANASSASLTLQGINNERSEGDKTITLTLSGNLPRGWSLPSGDATHEITLRDDDLGVGFTSSNTTRVEENVGNVVLSVAPNRTLTGAATIAWSVTAGSDELTSATATSGTLSFQTGDDGDDPQTIPLAVLDDNNAEDAEEVTVTLTATTLPSGWNISRNTHTFTIEPSDGTITFTETGTITAREGERINIGITSTADGPRGGYPLTISIPDGSNGSNDITFPATVTLPEGQKAQNFSITIRRDNTPENEETFTMSLGSGASAPSGWTASSSRTIIISANENTVTFGPPSSVTISSGESTTITASINLAIPVGTPSSQRNITITPSGNAVANTDYQLSVSSSLHGNLVDNNNSWTWTLPEGADSGGSKRDIDLTITAMGTNHRNLALDFGGTLLPGWNVTPASRSITLTPATGIPDVRTIGFASAETKVFENAGSVSIELAVSGFDASLLSTIDMGMVGALSDVQQSNETLQNIFTAGDELDVTQGGSGENPRIVVSIDNDSTTEGQETVTFTLPSSFTVGASPGMTVSASTANTHMLIIEPSDGFAIFSSVTDKGTVAENVSGGMTTITVPLFLPAVAPTGGLPLKLAITGGNVGNLVSFSSGSQVDETTFRVAEGAGSHDVTVYINDNDTDNPDRNVVFTLSADNSNNDFPTAWGQVGPTQTTYTLTVTDDDDAASIGFASAETKVFENAGSVSIELAVSGFDASLLSTIDMGMVGALSDVQQSNETLQNIFTAGDELDVTQGGSGENPRIVVSIDNDSTTEGQETVTFTLPSSFTVGASPGMTVSASTANTHMLIIEPSDGFAIFSSVTDKGTVAENVSGGMTTITVPLFLPAVAPTGGLPLKLAITGGNVGNLVSFSSGSQVDETTFRVAEGAGSHDVTVYINDNDTDNPDRNVVFTLSADNSNNDFPTAWGQVGPTQTTYTLTVTDDDDAASIGFASAETKVFENAGSVSIELAVSGFDASLLSTIDMGMVGALSDVQQSNETLQNIFTAGDELDVTQGGSGENPRIVVSIDNDSTTEGQETVTFTLPSSFTVGASPGMTVSASTANTHMLIIEPSDGFAIFSSVTDKGTVAENVSGGMTTITVPLFLPAVAPTGGLPLKLAITGGNVGNLVSFSSGSQVDETTFRVAEGAGSHDVTVYINDNDTDNPDRNVVFTLSADNSNNDFPTAWGQVGPTQTTYTLTVTDDDDVVVGDGRAGIGWFGPAKSKVSEDASSAIIKVELFGADLTSFVPAPSDGLPLKLEIVDDSGNTTTSNLVAFDMDGSLNRSGTFVIPVGRTSYDVTVYIIDNDEDANPENQVVKFKLREGDNFPTEWGKVGSEFNLDGFELTVEDNDPPTSGAPPRLPNPIRPPVQETSPKPSDEFPKEAKANP